MNSGKDRYGKIGVLSGGSSNEREISLCSGKAVYDALLKDGLDVVLLDVGKNVYDIIKKNNIDLAFISLHGRFGEDGSVQQILEDANVPYTGSGVDASRLALDKIASKDIFRRKGILTPKQVVFENSAYDIDQALILGWPIVVKPPFEGSSIGLSVANDKKELEGSIAEAFRYDSSILLEEYIRGRELTVGILDEEPLPVIEIVPADGIYDYKAKYSDPLTRYLVPAPIDESIATKAKSIGRRAHSALGCRCFSRVDMILDSHNEIYVLEVNTIPGMTERSLLPKAAAASGLDFRKLCLRLIEDASKRAAAKDRV